MTNRKTRVLHLLATGIAIGLILAAAFIIGHGNSERWVSIKNHAFAVADNTSPDGRPEDGALDTIDPSGADYRSSGAGKGSGAAQDPSDEVTESGGAFGNFDDADSESYEFDGGMMDEISPTVDGSVLSYGGDPNAWDPFAGVEAGGYPAPDPGGYGDSYPPPSYSDGLSGDEDELGGWDGRGLPPHMGPPSMPEDPRAEDWPTEASGAQTPEGGTPAATLPAQTATKPSAGTPSAAAPTATKPAATKPTATATRPAATQPAPTRPAPTLPASTKPPAPTVPPATTEPPAPTVPPTEAPTSIPATPEPSMPDGLVSVPAGAAPNLDGSGGDAAWASAPAVTIETSGGANQSAARVSVQSVYDAENVYFLLRWNDPSHSFQFHPWEKQADGSWQMLASAQHNDENSYYEDQLAVFWPALDGGQVLDLWQWQSVRSAGQADDLYQNGGSDSSRYPPSGGQPDPSSGGGYAFNVGENQITPAFMQPDGGSRDGAPGFIREDEKQPFDDSLFQPGARVPGIISAPWSGDRGDVRAAARYENGGWTLELRRARVTGSPYDVQFDSLDRVYAFGVATFDNTQQRYAGQNGLMAFRFGD